MKKHLSDETLFLLAKHRLRGKEFAEALLHIDSCEECRRKMPKPTKEEVLKAIFGEDIDEFLSPQPNDQDIEEIEMPNDDESTSH